MGIIAVIICSILAVYMFIAAEKTIDYVEKWWLFMFGIVTFIFTIYLFGTLVEDEYRENRHNIVNYK